MTELILLDVLCGCVQDCYDCYYADGQDPFHICMLYDMITFSITGVW